MPSALVTGITGQDGGYLADALIADGWQVHGLVRDADPAVDELLARQPRIVLHHGDLADPASVRRVVDDAGPDEIYNLGGVSSVAFSWSEPVLTAQVTGLGAAALFEAAWQLQQRRG
jgi:GDPmannose 4,6-dehydratase